MTATGRAGAPRFVTSGRAAASAGGGDGEGERRAASDPTLDPDGAAVELHELPTKGEPQTSPLVLGRAGADLAKLLEDRILVLGGDADAGIADRDLDRAVCRHRPNVDPAARRRELDRVRQQVEKDLFDLALVSLNLAPCLSHVRVEGDPSLPRPLAHQGDHVVDRLWQVEGRPLQLHAARLDLREIQDVVYQGEQMLPR